MAKAIKAEGSKNKVVISIDNAIRQSTAAKLDRMDKNRENFEMFNGRQDMTHKIKGQSKEFLPRLAMGVEQMAQFLQQGLLDFGDWFSANKRPGVADAIFTEEEIRNLIKWQLKNAKFYNTALDAFKSAILGSLAIIKVTGEKVPKRAFKVNRGKLLKNKDEVWQLKLDVIRHRNFHIDPDGDGLFKAEELEIDKWRLKKLSKEMPEFFDQEQLNLALQSSMGGNSFSHDPYKESEVNQNEAPHAYRKKLKLVEYWGHLLDPETGDLLHENCYALVANDQYVIVKPRPIANWDQKDSYVVAALIRVGNSQWHRAIADFGSTLNKLTNEIFNLLMDSGIQATYGITQIRENYLEDPSEVDGGVRPGQSVGITSATPPGVKVIERVDAGGTGINEAVNAFNIASSELNQSLLTNDVRAGALPSRSTKSTATEIVESSNTITSVTTGISKSVESEFVEPLLEKVLVQTLMNWKNLDKDELKGILGEERFEQINSKTEQEIFAKTYGGFSFSVFGITQTLNKIKDFRKLTTMLQAVSSNPQLMEAFVRKYDFTKLLGEIIKALDINEDRIVHDKINQTLNSLDNSQGNAVNPLNSLDGASTQLPQAGAGNGRFEEEPFSNVGAINAG